jgi:lysophospholipase L1-like esterase
MLEAKMNIIKTLVLLFTTFIAISLISCDSGGKMPEKTTHSPSIKDIPASLLKKLAQKKIYFGHQSVGFNIIDGIKDVMKENPQIKLNIVETSDPSKFNTPLFAHSRVGKNMDPKSKIDAFANFMENGIGNMADLAFFKFCYVDVTARTDVERVFADYKNTISRLRESYPGTMLIHVTAPLTVTKTTFKTWIKKIIRKKDIWEYDDNIKRNEFNDLLRNEFEGKEPIFDLAKLESTHPDGRMETFTKDGENYYSLVPGYTDDGGHLNEKGRKIIAEQLLILLAGLCE